MHEMVEQFALKNGEVMSKVRVREWFAEHYSKIKPGTIEANLTRMSTNVRGRVHHPVVRGDDDLFFQIDGGHVRLYEPDSDPTPIYKIVQSSSQHEGFAQSEEDADAQDAEQPREFAYEADLKNFLAKNLPLLEPGLRLYEEEGITGIEFPVGGRFIDILAIDQQDNYVVVELKVSKGYDRAVGQVLRYMNWMAKNHAEPPQTVRGIIVARNISEDLRLACAGLTRVKLFEYELSVQLHPVSASE